MIYGVIVCWKAIELPTYCKILSKVIRVAYFFYLQDVELKYNDLI